MKQFLYGMVAAVMTAGQCLAATTETTIAAPGDGGCDYYRIPAVVKAKDNRLIAVYDWRGSSNDDIQAGSDKSKRVKLMKRMSDDGGKTWTAQEELFPQFINQREHGDAALVHDLSQTGHIVCAMAADAYYGKSGGKILVSHSYDNGVTWETPAEMKITNKPAWTSAFVASGNMLYTSDGAIMCVVLGKESTCLLYTSPSPRD